MRSGLLRDPDNCHKYGMGYVSLCRAVSVLLTSSKITVLLTSRRQWFVTHFLRKTRFCSMNDLKNSNLQILVFAVNQRLWSVITSARHEKRAMKSLLCLCRRSHKVLRKENNYVLMLGTIVNSRNTFRGVFGFLEISIFFLIWNIFRCDLILWRREGV